MGSRSAQIVTTRQTFGLTMRSRHTGSNSPGWRRDCSQTLTLCEQCFTPTPEGPTPAMTLMLNPGKYRAKDDNVDWPRPSQFRRRIRRGHRRRGAGPARLAARLRPRHADRRRPDRQEIAPQHLPPKCHCDPREAKSAAHCRPGSGAQRRSRHRPDHRGFAVPDPADRPHRRHPGQLHRRHRGDRPPLQERHRAEDRSATSTRRSARSPRAGSAGRPATTSCSASTATPCWPRTRSSSSRRRCSGCRPPPASCAATPSTSTLARHFLPAS